MSTGVLMPALETNSKSRGKYLNSSELEKLALFEKRYGTEGYREVC